MREALEEHDGKTGTEGRNISNLQFVDDTDVLVEEQEALVESLDKICRKHRTELSAARRRQN